MTSSTATPTAPAAEHFPQHVDDDLELLLDAAVDDAAGPARAAIESSESEEEEKMKALAFGVQKQQAAEEAAEQTCSDQQPAQQQATEHKAQQPAQADSSKRSASSADDMKGTAKKRRKHYETSKPTDSETTSRSGTYSVVKVTRQLFTMLVNKAEQGPAAWIFSWTPSKKTTGQVICFVESGGTEVFGTAKVLCSSVINNFVQLRSTFAFNVASQTQKNAWRSRTWIRFWSNCIVVLYYFCHIL